MNRPISEIIEKLDTVIDPADDHWTDKDRVDVVCYVARVDERLDFGEIERTFACPRASVLAALNRVSVAVRGRARDRLSALDVRRMVAPEENRLRALLEKLRAALA